MPPRRPARHGGHASLGRRWQPHETCRSRQVHSHGALQRPAPSAAAECRRSRAKFGGQILTVRERLGGIASRLLQPLPSAHRPVRTGDGELQRDRPVARSARRREAAGPLGQDRPPIDVSGTLPNGRDFADFVRFKAALVAAGAASRGPCAKSCWCMPSAAPLSQATRWRSTRSWRRRASSRRPSARWCRPSPLRVCSRRSEDDQCLGHVRLRTHSYQPR